MKTYVLIKIRVGEVKDVVRQLRKTEKIVEANMTLGSMMPWRCVEQTLTCLAVEI
jgi:hypothetical protein